ncbi:MAG: hypothetical protein HY907_20095 [Deltaproteobacteria bacterium]|nr:hypothetical protein [Deltaproteobacteria bacterium]
MGAARTDSVGRWYCTGCRSRHDATGDCPRCPGEPLLDLADDEVRLMLESQDDAAKRKRYGLYVGIGALLGVPLFFLGSVLTEDGRVGLGMGVAGALAIAWVLMRFLPPRRVAPPISQAELTRWTGRVRYSLPPLDPNE